MSKKLKANDIMKEIKDKKVQMHSRRYFLGMAATTALATLALFFATALFAILLIRDATLANRFGLFNFEGFGPAQYLRSFPWGLLVLAVVSFAGVIYLVKKYEIAYHHRTFVWTGALVAAIAMTSGAIAVSGMHDSVAERGPFSGLSTISEFKRHRHVIGEVIEKTEFGFKVERLNGEEIDVIVNDKTKYRETSEDEIAPGDVVGAIGEYEDDEFSAEGLVLNPPLRNKPKLHQIPEIN